jgi:hypothetical protein
MAQIIGNEMSLRVLKLDKAHLFILVFKTKIFSAISLAISLFILVRRSNNSLLPLCKVSGIKGLQTADADQKKRMNNKNILLA